MSVQHQYKRFMEVKVVPLGGVPPVVYNFEFSLSAKIKDLKNDLIVMMARHKHRIQFSLYGYLRSKGILSCDAYMIPSEIIHLCGLFYDAYYPLSTNINLQTLAVFRNLNELITDDNMPFLINKAHLDDAYYIYELMDAETIHKHLKLNVSHNIPSDHYAIIPIHHFSIDEHDKIGQPLLIKLPIKIEIAAEPLKRMLDRMIRQYIDGQFAKQWKESNATTEPLYMLNLYGDSLSRLQSIQIHDTAAKRISVVANAANRSYQEIALAKHSVLLRNVGASATLSNLQTVAERVAGKVTHTEIYEGVRGQGKAILNFSNAKDAENAVAKIHGLRTLGILRATYINYAREDALVILWNRNTQNVFKHTLFSHPHDTFDHLMSERFEEDETEKIEMIQSMFD